MQAEEGQEPLTAETKLHRVVGGDHSEVAEQLDLNLGRRKNI
jgi:hypothetical protein